MDAVVWNPITGCSKISAGCQNCWAETRWEKLSDMRRSIFYRRNFNDVKCHHERLIEPFLLVDPTVITVCDISDLFHEKVEDEYISAIFAVMAHNSKHTFVISTKRIERAVGYFKRFTKCNKKQVAESLRSSLQYYLHPFLEDCETFALNLAPPIHWPLPNVKIGVSVENQSTADERIPLLLQTPAVERFLCIKPLIGPISLPEGGLFGSVEIGEEKGENARPCRIEWIKSLKDQCDALSIKTEFSLSKEKQKFLAEEPCPATSLSFFQQNAGAEPFRAQL